MEKKSEIWVYLAKIWKLWKMLFHLLLEVAENSKRTFRLNGKRPIVCYNAVFSVVTFLPREGRCVTTRLVCGFHQQHNNPEDIF